MDSHWGPPETSVADSIKDLRRVPNWAPIMELNKPNNLYWILRGQYYSHVRSKKSFTSSFHIDRNPIVVTVFLFNMSLTECHCVWIWKKIERISKNFTLSIKVPMLRFYSFRKNKLITFELNFERKDFVLLFHVWIIFHWRTIKLLCGIS